MHVDPSAESEASGDITSDGLFGVYRPPPAADRIWLRLPTDLDRLVSEAVLQGEHRSKCDVIRAALRTYAAACGVKHHPNTFESTLRMSERGDDMAQKLAERRRRRERQMNESVSSVLRRNSK